MNVRQKSSYGMKRGQQPTPASRVQLQTPSHPKYIPFYNQAYLGHNDRATRAAPKHSPYEVATSAHVSRPKSAVSGRSRRTDFSRQQSSKCGSKISRRKSTGRPGTAAHVRRSRATELEQILENERVKRKSLENEVEQLRMLSSHALSFYNQQN